MKSLYILVLGFEVLIYSAKGGDAPPNPYQIFAQEHPEIYRIPSNQSSRVQGDPTPDLTKRPLALRPGALPTGVRYCFAADSAMADAAALLTNRFCGQAVQESSLFGETLVVHPGAWASLKQPGLLGKKSATPWGFLVWDGKVNQKLSGIVLRDRDELKEVAASILQEVQNGGGATVRALSTTEMSKWWIFIGFDIQEPTLALETRDKKRLFIFGFVNRQAVVLDELNSLPDFGSPPNK